MTEFNSFALITGLISGLAMFMYGMNIMSSALTKTAGGRLEQMLVRITSNRWVAYVFGILITAAVQSSSASTVMVVGLVNAGLMNLAEAVNIILGANLGTTFTAWLLSLNSISSDNFFINLLKPSSFTPFLALIGIALYMFSHTDKKKNVGSILLGFSVLMFGMNTMSGAVAPLRKYEAFTELLTGFSNPALGFLVGMLFTMIIQSSAATIGILQALALSVPMTYAAAMPIVIGSEVGTCITAVLSSLGANRNGKRTAAMHLGFNFIKAVGVMLIFYTLNIFMRFDFLELQAGMVGIATIHTLVNLIATPLMVPCSGLLVKLAYSIIPVTDQEKESDTSANMLRSLDDRFITNPPFALQQVKLAVIDMANMTRDCFVEASKLIREYSAETVDTVKRLEERVDNYEDQIGAYLTKINSRHLDSQSSYEVSLLMNSINDFERISDHCRNIAETFEDVDKKGKLFSDVAVEEIEIMMRAVNEIVDITIESFETKDNGLAGKVEPLEETIDRLSEDLKKRHMKRLYSGKCSIDAGFDLSDLSMNLERISDHCSNIALYVLQVTGEAFDAHEYIDRLNKLEIENFRQQVFFYENKYMLPSDSKKKSGEDDEKKSRDIKNKDKKKKEKKKDKDKDKKKKEKSK